MSTTRKYGGTGLGLSIVKKLIELHTGSIDCVSRKNHGTKITCHIPYFKGDEKKVKKDVEQPLYIPEEIRKLKILIVDDEEYNRLLFKTILSRWNVKYSEAANGIEALEMLKSDRYDLLFMDARMPGIDGLKATQLIRNEMNITESEMPVICISAASVSEDWQKYRKAGMNAFLPKPFTEEMLLSTVLSVIKDYAADTINDDEEKIEPAASEKINLHNLYHISGGDEQFVKQMVVSFIDSTQKGLNEMKEAAFSGRLDSVADLAHKMLPPCRHIGAGDLCNHLRKIEEIIQKKGDPGFIVTLTEKSILEFESVGELLKEHIRKIG
jgi:CheY-like chemotaxis protein/HPt (histidine-containing phosphotransfer) domain-containing protein